MKKIAKLKSYSIFYRGYSLEDLQHTDVKRSLQEQTTGCPVLPTCTSPTINRYRTADGSCNNVDNPGWGQAGRPQARLKHAAYGKNDDQEI